MTVLANDPTKAGANASKPLFVGPWHRYKVQAVHTRFDAVCWFTFDAETIDDVTGGPAAIAQHDTLSDALAAIDDHEDDWEDDDYESIA